MAIIILDDADLVVDSEDYSDHVRSITINYGATIQDATAMQGGADAGFTRKLAGLKDWSVDVEFNQDYAAASIDAWLFTQVGAAGVTMVASGDDTITYTGTVLLESYNPIAGSVGDLATTTVTWQGSGALARA